MFMMLFLAAEKNRGKKNDFEYYVCWGVSTSFVFVAFMEVLYDDTHIRESKRSKKKKKKKKNVVITFHLNLNVADYLKGSSRAN